MNNVDKNAYEYNNVLVNAYYNLYISILFNLFNYIPIYINRLHTYFYSPSIFLNYYIFYYIYITKSMADF
jgi:hypothetical protein